MLLDGGVLKEREQRAALGCCDAPPLPVLRFGIGSRHFQRAEVTGGAAWQLAVQLSTGLFQGCVEWLAGGRCPVRSWGACCSLGQAALAPAAPQWPVQSCSSPEMSPEPTLERGGGHM